MIPLVATSITLPVQHLAGPTSLLPDSTAASAAFAGVLGTAGLGVALPTAWQSPPVPAGSAGPGSAAPAVAPTEPDDPTASPAETAADIVSNVSVIPLAIMPFAVTAPITARPAEPAASPRETAAAIGLNARVAGLATVPSAAPATIPARPPEPTASPPQIPVDATATRTSAAAAAQAAPNAMPDLAAEVAVDADPTVISAGPRSLTPVPDRAGSANPVVPSAAPNAVLDAAPEAAPDVATNAASNAAPYPAVGTTASAAPGVAAAAAFLSPTETPAANLSDPAGVPAKTAEQMAKALVAAQASARPPPGLLTETVSRAQTAQASLPAGRLTEAVSTMQAARISPPADLLTAAVSAAQTAHARPSAEAVTAAGHQTRLPTSATVVAAAPAAAGSGGMPPVAAETGSASSLAAQAAPVVLRNWAGSSETALLLRAGAHAAPPAGFTQAGAVAQPDPAAPAAQADAPAAPVADPWRDTSDAPATPVVGRDTDVSVRAAMDPSRNGVPPLLPVPLPLPVPPPHPATVAPRPLPADTIPALLHSMRTAASDMVELVMTPSDLGHLRFEMVKTGDHLHITLTVERPETLELLRRNSEPVLADFRQAGYAGATFSFGQGASGGQPQTPAPPNAAPQTAPPPRDAPAPPLSSEPGLQGTGLDLRL